MEITGRMHSMVPRKLTTREEEKNHKPAEKKPPSPEATNIISPVF